MLPNQGSGSKVKFIIDNFSKALTQKRGHSKTVGTLLGPPLGLSLGRGGADAAFAQGVRLEIRAVLKSKTSGLAQNHRQIEQNQQGQTLYFTID